MISRRLFLRGGVVTGGIVALGGVGMLGNALAEQPKATGPTTFRYKGSTVVLGKIPTDIQIDGEPLHVMIDADGSLTSIMNHYQTFDTPEECARAAVDALAGASLTPSHQHGAK